MNASDHYNAAIWAANARSIYLAAVLKKTKNREKRRQLEFRIDSLGDLGQLMALQNYYLKTGPFETQHE